MDRSLFFLQCFAPWMATRPRIISLYVFRWWCPCRWHSAPVNGQISDFHQFWIPSSGSSCMWIFKFSFWTIPHSCGYRLSTVACLLLALGAGAREATSWQDIPALYLLGGEQVLWDVPLTLIATVLPSARVFDWVDTHVSAQLRVSLMESDSAAARQDDMVIQSSTLGKRKSHRLMKEVELSGGGCHVKSSVRRAKSSTRNKYLFICLKF